MLKLPKHWITAPKHRLYNLEIPVIGLTGGIATGKSTASKILKELGIPLICADQLIKEIYQKQETFEFIQKHFKEVIENGAINFKKLRKVVFPEKPNLELLESFLYPQMKQEFFKKLESYTNASFVVYDVPLLFEKLNPNEFDHILVVYIPRTMQIERLTKRDNIDDDLANSMLNSQKNIEEKKAAAHVVLDNTKTKKDLKNQILNYFS